MLNMYSLDNRTFLVERLGSHFIVSKEGAVLSKNVTVSHVEGDEVEEGISFPINYGHETAYCKCGQNLYETAYSNDIYDKHSSVWCSSCGKVYHYEVSGTYREYCSNEAVFYCAYRVIKSYGGPEEGGWYFDAYGCIDFIDLRDFSPEMKQKAIDDFQLKYAHQDNVVILNEYFLYQSETCDRPAYS